MVPSTGTVRVPYTSNTFRSFHGVYLRNSSQIKEVYWYTVDLNEVELTVSCECLLTPCAAMMYTNQITNGESCSNLRDLDGNQRWNYSAVFGERNIYSRAFTGNTAI